MASTRSPKRGDLVIYRANLLTVFEVNAKRERVRAGMLQGVGADDRPDFLKVTTSLDALLWCPREDVLSTVVGEFVALVAGARALAPFGQSSEARIRSILEENPDEEGFWLMPGMLMCKHPGRVALPIGKASELRELLHDLYR